MSRKKEINQPELSTPIVDNSPLAALAAAEQDPFSGDEYVPPQQDELGREIVSPISLVSIADSRPMTLGERIRRYTSLPQFQHDLQAGHDDELSDEDMDLAEMDMHENPLSNHEERTFALRARIQERKNLEAEAEKQKKIDQEKADNEAFRKRYEALQKEAAQSVKPEKKLPKE